MAAEQFLVPAEGLSAWVAPDPAGVPVAELAPDTPVQVTERRGAWAQVLCENGWSGWVDGRRLVAAQPAPTPSAPAPPPPPPPPTESTWTATHVVPTGGLDAWETPDAARAPVAHLDAGTKLTVRESHPNGWAQVAAANGWQTWVDGRRLVAASGDGAAPAAPASGPPGVDAPFGITMPPWWPVEVPVAPAAGALLVLLGSFLPWLSFGFGSASAWDIPIPWLLTGDSFAGGFKVGLLLLAVVAVGVPALTKKPLNPAVLPTIGLVVIGLALVTLIRGLVGTSVLGTRVSYNPSIGLFMSLAGGAILAIDRLRAWMERVRNRNAS